MQLSIQTKALLIFIVALDVVRVCGRKEYTYMPQSACDVKPPSSALSNNFSLWGFLTASIVMSTVVGNLVSNVNNNNNNNNDNNNQINNNNRNDNANADENSNMNTNMIIPGRRRRSQLEDYLAKALPTQNFTSTFIKRCVHFLLCKYMEENNGYGECWLYVYSLKSTPES